MTYNCNYHLKHLQSHLVCLLYSLVRNVEPSIVNYFQNVLMNQIYNFSKFYAAFYMYKISMKKFGHIYLDLIIFHDQMTKQITIEVRETTIYFKLESSGRFFKRIHLLVDLMKVSDQHWHHAMKGGSFQKGTYSTFSLSQLSSLTV